MERLRAEMGVLAALYGNFGSWVKAIGVLSMLPKKVNGGERESVVVGCRKCE